jgi:hypothetical protein
MAISDIEIIKPSDLDNASVGDISADDFIIRELASDGQVLSQRVKDLMGMGPFTFLEMVLGGAAPTIADGTSSVLNLSVNKYKGMFYDTEWYPGTNPESIVIPADGFYLFLINTTVEGGTVSGEASVQLVFEPAGTPSVIAESHFLTGGMGVKKSTSFFKLKEAYSGDEYGIQYTNDGLADFTVDDSLTSIFVIKLA